MNCYLLFRWPLTFVPCWSALTNPKRVIMILCFRERSWLEAVKWYQRAIDIVDEDGDPHPLHTDPNYALTAAQARLYQQGGYGLDKDPQTAGEMYSAAGDLAIASMKGKMANKYYVMAEEAWAELEE